MTRPLFSVTAASLLAAGLLFSVPDGSNADALMTACESEIGSICPGVSKGRGRISACLYAYGHQLSGPCKGEVDKVSNGRTFQKNVPATVTKLRGSPYEAELREICGGDASSLCSGVREGDGRLLACLYAQQNTVSAACATKAKAVLKEIK